MQRGHTVTGRVVLVSNRRQSYNVNIELAVEEQPGTYASNTLDLKNPYFRYTGAPIQPPPGCNNTSPSEDYWATMDTSGATTANSGLCNGLQNASAATAATVVQNGTAAASLLLNGATVLPNGLPVAAMNSGPMGMTTPVNLTAAAAAAAAAAVASGQREIPFGDLLSLGQTGVQGGLYAPQGGSGGNVVNNINTMNFPVNSSLMIGDYAAAVGGQTIPPFKPM